MAVMDALGMGADLIRLKGGRNYANLCATVWMMTNPKSGFTMGTADRKPAR